MVIHECYKYKGMIKDVGIRYNNIYCRGCGSQLNENQVDKEVLSKIKERLI